VPEVHAVQWVQGVGDDLPIMQWVPFIQDLQAKNVPVIVDLHKNEVDEFVSGMEPQGLFLWVATDNEDEEKSLLKRIAKWA
jgi:nucleoside-triphosphatase THEP1